MKPVAQTLDAKPSGLTTTGCDGPIRPDGSWKRCAFNQPYYGIPPLPLGQPNYHIEGLDAAAARELAAAFSAAADLLDG